MEHISNELQNHISKEDQVTIHKNNLEVYIGSTNHHITTGTILEADCPTLQNYNFVETVCVH